jgi:hypothetical protein
MKSRQGGRSLCIITTANHKKTRQKIPIIEKVDAALQRISEHTSPYSSSSSKQQQAHIHTYTHTYTYTYTYTPQLLTHEFVEKVDIGAAALQGLTTHHHNHTQAHTSSKQQQASASSSSKHTQQHHNYSPMNLLKKSMSALQLCKAYLTTYCTYASALSIAANL